ncbi:DUF4157 domain-containing protein [Kamptonema formosum]|uniref:DUF4157 domain-containing protein n=1 Tax=Kamptonema formosum TaxID=331992 RepID=UPI001E3423ED|nr:DUF4157 domain-containing protein [Oscillatoria sp. PCC 10802]
MVVNSFDIGYSSQILAQMGKEKVPKNLSEKAWGEVGAVAYRGASQFMGKNNGWGRGLDDLQKRYLRPHFGDLVDRVEVVYGATLMDEWVAASLRIDVGKSNAQVYGHKIYVTAPYKPGDVKQLILLSHELVHVQQYEELGGIDKFGYQYFKEYKRAGQNYRRNKMERDAFVFEAKFARWLSEELAKYPEEEVKVKN